MCIFYLPSTLLRLNQLLHCSAKLKLIQIIEPEPEPGPGPEPEPGPETRHQTFIQINFLLQNPDMQHVRIQYYVFVMNYV